MYTEPELIELENWLDFVMELDPDGAGVWRGSRPTIADDVALDRIHNLIALDRKRLKAPRPIPPPDYRRIRVMKKLAKSKQRNESCS